MHRRQFIQALVTALPGRRIAAAQARQPDRPGRISNEYTLFLPGEREALNAVLSAVRIDPEASIVDVRLGGIRLSMRIGDTLERWKLASILSWHNGTPVAVFEKHVTHQGVLLFLSEQGDVARIPKQIGQLSNIRPRPINAPEGLAFERPRTFTPGPDQLGEYILNSPDDPSYENVAALGREYTGWVLVSDDGLGPEKSLWLQPDGSTREFASDAQLLWAPDANGRLFEPVRLLPLPYLYSYVAGYSKRTMLAGFLPVADIGVWNPEYHVGYEVTMVLSGTPDRKPIARVRATVPPGRLPNAEAVAGATRPEINGGEFIRYWNGEAEEFYASILGMWQRWNAFFDMAMHVDIPDTWLSTAAKAGLVLCRCSCRGSQPTYQIGEGGYTKIPERSHALFPVAQYQYVWAHQIWNLTNQVERSFQLYLDQYILSNGNFAYCEQDQVEAPLNTGVFLENCARAYDYTQDVEALRRRLPVLRRMISFVLARRQYSREMFPPEDPRHGLVWGSPEADNGDPGDDAPASHPYFYQNATWIWRGFTEHARCLQRASKEHGDAELDREGKETAEIGRQMRLEIERSLRTALSNCNPEMKGSGITPFSPFDTQRNPTYLTSYENHRYMMDWWTSDWGDPVLDEGHFRHRRLAGLEILGMNIASDDVYGVLSGSLLTANFMEHGTLAGRIREDDYRPFLLTMYANLCYGMDSGSRFAPEDALVPGGFAGEGVRWNWSPVVNSELQPAMALRWLLCYEEHDRDIVHLQKAAPKHWFLPGKTIAVERCPTRFGQINWSTESISQAVGTPRWKVRAHLKKSSATHCDVVLHIHPSDGRELTKSSAGKVIANTVIMPSQMISGEHPLEIQVY